VLTGCGISLRAENSGSEIFQELVVEGEFIAGEPLTFTLTYEQPYPVEVAIACDLLERKPDTDVVRGLRRILRDTLPANPQGGPLDEATPVADSLQHTFPAPERPGRYIVACFTKDDRENAIGEEITIVPPPP